MQVVILAGGLGTRLSEETVGCPKPMLPIGRKPILWHIMKIFDHAGLNDFIIACGYKAEIIKEYFHNFYIHNNDYLVQLKNGEKELLANNSVSWNVAAIDTGLHTMTGGRIARIEEHTNKQTFMVTYGDGVGNIDIKKLIAFHKSHGKLATVTAVRPPARFGELNIKDDKVENFLEKPQMHQGWINGGFFVFEPDVFKYLQGDDCVLEQKPLEQLALDGELMAFKHEGFWHPMDTLREKRTLEKLWDSGEAPWKTWD